MPAACLLGEGDGYHGHARNCTASHRGRGDGDPERREPLRAEDYVQPDLFVVPAAEVTGDWRDCQTLLLAIEVVSPSSARGDRFKKRRLYQRRGVETYWVVDPDAQLIEVWHPADERPEIVSDVARWQVQAGVAGLRIEVPPLFGRLPG